MTDWILEDREGPVVVLTLNDPKRANPLSSSLMDSLRTSLATTATDPAVRAVVLAGAGRHFSAGADLAALEEIARGGEAANRADAERLRRLFEEL